MNDDFLYRFRKSPPPEYAASLYERINRPMNTKPKLSFWGRAALVMSTLCVAFVLTMFFSPTVRAAVSSVLNRVIGGVSFTEITDFPGTSSDDEVNTAPKVNTTPEVNTVQQESMTLAEAQAVFPYTFNIPTWAPDRYTLDEKVSVTRFSPDEIFVNITWSQPMGTLTMTVAPKSTEHVIGTDSAEEVQVNGQPAALVRGVWDADTQSWDNPEYLTLYWNKDDVTYELDSWDMSVDEMIRMAESVP